MKTPVTPQMVNVDEIIQFAAARKQHAERIIQQLTAPDPTVSDIPDAVTATQWKDAGGIIPLAPDVTKPSRQSPEILSSSIQNPPPEPEPKGLLVKGNIDLAHRPSLENADGTTSTVRSQSFGINGREILLPTIAEDGMPLTQKEAVAQFMKTGKHLGMFDSVAAANVYATAVHKDQQDRLNAVQTPVAGPSVSTERANVEVVPRPDHIQKTLDFLSKVEGFRPNPARDNFVRNSEGPIDPKTGKRGFWKYTQGFGMQQDTRTGQPVNLVSAPVSKLDAEVATESHLNKLDTRLDSLLKVPVTQNQRSALLSLMYNLSPAGFANSQILEAVNQKAPPKKLWEAMQEHVTADIKGKGKSLVKGLERRRAAEFKLFMTPDSTD